MAGSGRGVFLLFPQYRKGSLFLIALPFLETTVGILGAPRGSARSWGHGTHVLRSSFLASCTPLHNFRYGIQKQQSHMKLKGAPPVEEGVLMKVEEAIQRLS